MKKSEATHLKYLSNTCIGGHLLENFIKGTEYPVLQHNIRAGYQVIVKDDLIWLSHSIVKRCFKKLYRKD